MFLRSIGIKRNKSKLKNSYLNNKLYFRENKTILTKVKEQ